jgi:uncharacterized membrane protein
MSLGSLLLGVWLILVGISWAAIVAIDIKFLGFWALVTGIVWLVEGVHPIVIPVRRVQ